jgi:hypothetical protein
MPLRIQASWRVVHFRHEEKGPGLSPQPVGPRTMAKHATGRTMNSCPLPRPLGRTIPDSGTHRELPPTEGGSTMRLVKLAITRPTERTEDDGRRRLTCSL